MFISCFTNFYSHVYAEENVQFIGIEDCDVEENTHFDLLKDVQATLHDGTPLQVTVENVKTMDKELVDVIDPAAFLIGRAGTQYQIGYLAVDEDQKEYHTVRTITSIASSSFPSQPQTQDITHLEKSKDGYRTVDGKTFDVDAPFVVDGEISPTSVMKEDTLPISIFTLRCINQVNSDQNCTNLTFGKITEIPSGLITDTAPDMLRNQNGKAHTFHRAYIGYTDVYYIGKLKVYDSDGSEHIYTYYTTDKNITDKTYYVVLPENKKITLEYVHGIDHEVSYHFTKNGQPVTEGPESQTFDDVFGKDRITYFGNGYDYSGTVQIPRGYKGTVTVKVNGTIHSEQKLGEMMEYEKDPNDPNKLQLKDSSPTSMIYNDNITISSRDIPRNAKIEVNLDYQKVDTLVFQGYDWTQTVYAKDRMYQGKIRKISESTFWQPAKYEFGNVPTPQNMTMEIGPDHEMEFDFVGASMYGTTWELDQLEMNGETITVPMVKSTLATAGPEHMQKETTVLSTGTVVEVSVYVFLQDGKKHIYGGEEPPTIGTVGQSVYRQYKLKISNCYENVTISGGNMVGHTHREFVIRHLDGPGQPQYWSYEYTNQKHGWQTMYQDSLIDRKNDNYYNDPIRFKRGYGRGVPSIRFSQKDGTVLQENSVVTNTAVDTTEGSYIEYLNLKPNISDYNLLVQDNKVQDENFDIVSYEQWKPSSEGYYYFRGSKKLADLMGTAKDNGSYPFGVVLIDIELPILKYALDYETGSDPTGVIAPKEEDVTGMPLFQDGGKHGYNIVDNPEFLIANGKPVDKSGNFFFDHWEAVETEMTEDGFGHKTGNIYKDTDGNPIIYGNGEYQRINESFLNNSSHYTYFRPSPDGNSSGNRVIYTVRAIWTKIEHQSAIPYVVQYYVDSDSKPILEQTYTTNQGATVVADLWQDAHKTLSPSIQNILKGNNNTHTDYTEGDTVEWFVDEEKTDIQKIIEPNNNIVRVYLYRKSIAVTIHKMVRGSYADMTKKFLFHIQASDAKGNPFTGSFDSSGGTLNFTDGEAQVRLGNEESIIIRQIPFGTNMMIFEDAEDAKGYQVTYDGKKENKNAQLVVKKDTTVEVLNESKTIVDTGIDLHKEGNALLAGGGILLLAFLYLMHKKKNRMSKG